LTEDEEGFFNEGLIPTPSDVNWYEFSLNGCQSALLLDDKFNVIRIDDDPDSGTRLIDGAWVCPDKEGKLMLKAVKTRTMLLEHYEDWMNTHYSSIFKLALDDSIAE